MNLRKFAKKTSQNTIEGGDPLVTKIVESSGGSPALSNSKEVNPNL